MENYIFWFVNTWFFILETSCEHTARFRSAEYDDHEWFPHALPNEYVGRKMWQNNKPEPPMSPFHPEELPIGLRSPFPGFRDSIYEKVIKPYFRNNYVARQYSAKNDADNKVLFRHEVEKLKYRPEVHHIQKSRPGRANHQEKTVSNSGKSVPQPRGISDLPLRDPRKPMLYSDLVFHI